MTFFQIIVSLSILAIVVASLLAPLESLTWWAGWLGDKDDLDDVPVPPSTSKAILKYPKAFIIYLTGIGSYSESTIVPMEQRLLERLDEAIDDIVIVNDIYTYSATNNNLTDGRFSSKFWRYIAQNHESNSPIRFLINARNILQVLVAADRRYGPMYAHGIARVIIPNMS
ncbi:MAG: hypothetical protein Phog2KO_50130 [Phototrophicaceae bacterium]